MEALWTIVKGALVEAPVRAFAEMQWGMMVFYTIWPIVVIIVALVAVNYDYPFLGRLFRKLFYVPVTERGESGVSGTDVPQPQGELGTKDEIKAEGKPTIPTKSFKESFAESKDYIESFFAQAEKKLKVAPGRFGYILPKGISYDTLNRREKPQGEREQYRIEVTEDRVLQIVFSLDETARLSIERVGTSTEFQILHTARRVGVALTVLDDFLNSPR